MEESRFFLYSVCMGLIITFIYDFIRLARAVIVHSNFFITLEDIIFWIFTSCALFLMLHKVNNGMLRWFTIAGALLGMVMYRKSLGQYMVVFLTSVIKKIQHLVLQIFTFIFSPIRWLLLKIKPVFMRITQKSRMRGKKARNRLTAYRKRVKISLCKHKNRDGGEVEL